MLSGCGCSVVWIGLVQDLFEAQTEGPQLLTEGVAADAEQLAGPRLVILRMVENAGKKDTFQGGNRLVVEVPSSLANQGIDQHLQPGGRGCGGGSPGRGPA